MSQYTKVSEVFYQCTRVAAPAAEAFAWDIAPGWLTRFLLPWPAVPCCPLPCHCNAAHGVTHRDLIAVQLVERESP